MVAPPSGGDELNSPMVPLTIRLPGRPCPPPRFQLRLSRPLPFLGKNVLTPMAMGIAVPAPMGSRLCNRARYLRRTEQVQSAS
jgi:hypothetical protein